VEDKQKGINKRMEKITDAQNKHATSFYQYFRNITTVSIGFLGLFISLKPEKFNNEIVKCLFVLIILLFGLSVIFSLITQHGEHYMNGKLIKARAKILLEYMNSDKTYQSLMVKKKWYHRFSEKLTYVSLFFAIIALIMYSYYLVF